ncbi:MAG: hypothetical protein KA715_04155 [Xanthomonadaceae bacterium]|nr:hypothetical protein [Xanthomonadaceae bacterium]
MDDNRRHFFRMALPQLQWKLISLILAFGAGTCILSVFAVSVGLIQMRGALSHFPEAQHVIDRFSDRVMFYLLVSFVVSAVFNLTVFFIILRRLAGPIERLRDYFKKMSVSPESHEQLRFRGGDFFMDLPPVVNQAMKEIRASESKLKKSKKVA